MISRISSTLLSWQRKLGCSVTLRIGPFVASEWDYGKQRWGCFVAAIQATMCSVLACVA